MIIQHIPSLTIYIRNAYTYSNIEIVSNKQNIKVHTNANHTLKVSFFS